MSDHPQEATSEQTIGASPTEEGGAPEPASNNASAAPATESAAASDLSERIAALEKERDEYLDQWRRSAAEFQNFRKREERMRGERERNASARLLLKLLPVLDDLQRAAHHVPTELTENEWVQGMFAIERKLWNVLEQEGVAPIPASKGEEFDPKVHEALVAQPSEEYESGQIIEELERGYRMGDTILRPSRVAVAQ